MLTQGVPKARSTTPDAGQLLKASGTSAIQRTSATDQWLAVRWFAPCGAPPQLRYDYDYVTVITSNVTITITLRSGGRDYCNGGNLDQEMEVLGLYDS